MSLSPPFIVILNGPPRAGKTSLARAIQSRGTGHWVTLGVDGQSADIIAPDLRPGIGLRPGGERPDLEPVVPRLYRALYRSIRGYAEEGFNVVADLGHHEDYATLGPILPQCAGILAGFDVLFVGVGAPLETILERRARSEDRPGTYLQARDGAVPAPVARWQRAVYGPPDLDLEIDTARVSPEAAARVVLDALGSGRERPGAFERFARALNEK